MSSTLAKHIVCCLLDVSAVLETGWQLEQIYDPATCITSLQQTRISKASQVQRQGRAGRTRAGTCYTMYTKEDFDKFPDYSTPDVLKTNLDSFLLSMVATGLDPLAATKHHKLLDQDRLKYASQSPAQSDATLVAVLQICTTCS